MFASRADAASRLAAAAMTTALLAVTIYYAGSTLFAVWHYGWSEMFADQFWQYTKLIEQPFPDNLLVPDSQHRQVLSHLLRIADIRYGHGDQVIGIVVGLLAMAAMLAAVLAVIWRQREESVLSRAALTSFATMALMWMGSARMQFHGNEAFQIYLIMLCALLAILAVETLRASSRPRFLWLALGTATLAAMTFASGIAVFGLVVAMLWLRRLRGRWVLASVAATLLLVLAYAVLMPGSDSIRGMVSLAPGPIASHASAWLGAAWTNAWLVFADAGILGVDGERMLHERLGSPLVLSARWISSVFGQPSNVSMATAIGGAGLGVLALLGVRLWRCPADATRIEVVGFGLAIFAVGVALLVAIGRAQLFAVAPDQVLADRYVPWSALFWLGLAMATAARVVRRPGGTWVTAVAALLLSMLLYPTHRLGYGWAAAMERAIEARAAQLQSGVYATGMARHCSIANLDYVRGFVATLREQRVGMFRHPRNHLLGAVLEDLPVGPAPRAWVGDPRPVREDGSQAFAGWEVQGVLLAGDLRERIDGLVVVDPDQRVVGIGEFSHRSRRAGLFTRIDRIADGFDAAIVADAACDGLRLYGVDAAAKRFVALATLSTCSDPAR
ncbi:MAG TPA: hypothetical protein VN581_13225 [Patescibacteria group bacterium]|nr:hypothetical protein [Patescibacteria group bacterium]